MSDEPLLQSNIPDLDLFSRGKVRDTYDLGDRLLMVASDRLSAFDVVFPNGIPMKGKVLTAMSVFWFNLLGESVSHHLLTSKFTRFPDFLQKYRDQLEGRSLLIKKTTPLAIECIVRGYLSGSGWREYQVKGSVCGISLPDGMVESDKLPEPIFTPSTKAESGHDVNITEKQTKAILGGKRYEQVKRLSLSIYKRASEYAVQRGIIIADTKFEFGLIDDELVLIDEVLTPDSSRFWPSDEYNPGGPQPSFDKQYVRDYLETQSWNKQPPAPPLPSEVVAETSRKYLEAYTLLTGNKLV